jgi:hypothetical protein
MAEGKDVELKGGAATVAHDKHKPHTPVAKRISRYLVIRFIVQIQLFFRRGDENHSENAADIYQEPPQAIPIAHWSMSEPGCRDAGERTPVVLGGNSRRARALAACSSVPTRG